MIKKLKKVGIFYIEIFRLILVHSIYLMLNRPFASLLLALFKTSNIFIEDQYRIFEFIMIMAILGNSLCLAIYDYSDPED
jgi:hypothetical protein